MTTYLGKSCSFCLPRVPFVNCRQFMYLVISLFGFEGRIWNLIVSVPDHCLSFYFFSFYDSVRQNVFAEHNNIAQHIACYNFWSFKLKHESNLSIFSPNQNY